MLDKLNTLFKDNPNCSIGALIVILLGIVNIVDSVCTMITAIVK